MPTSALTQDLKTKVWGKEFILNINDPAPNRGVLVPEYNYRQYQKAYEMRFEKDSSLNYADLVEARECPKCIVHGPDWNGYALSFTLGALATALVLPAFVHR